MLNPQQLAARKGKLTASRMSALVNGDSAAIMQLWLEMTDQAEPENLDHVWPVRLGSATEQLNLDWFEARNGPVIRRGEVVVHSSIPWAACTLDGWIRDLNCGIETKHCGGREPFEVIVDRYQPQLQWSMLVTGADQWALSVILGANEPIVEFIPFAREYADQMVVRGEQFMKFVAARKPPVVLDAVPAPVDASKIYDMSTNNEWVAYAGDWLANIEGADICKGAEKILKAAVPADAKKCFGGGVRITRDRAGRLSLRGGE